MKKQIVNMVKDSPLECIYRWLKKIQLHGNAEEPSMKSMDFYSGLVMKGDLVFDVGANYGNRTRVFGKLGASIIAFEPQEICFEYLKSFFSVIHWFVL